LLQEESKIAECSEIGVFMRHPWIDVKKEAVFGGWIVEISCGEGNLVLITGHPDFVWLLYYGAKILKAVEKFSNYEGRKHYNENSERNGIVLNGILRSKEDIEDYRDWNEIQCTYVAADRYGDSDRNEIEIDRSRLFH
jgi:hypothetical protein